MKRRRKTIVRFKESDQSATTTAEYSFSLTKIAVSQICRSVGYIATDSSAVNTLTLITTKFLQSLAGLASSFTNTSNRTEVNIFDIVNALQNISLSTSDWFPGGSIIHNTESNCLIKSGVLRNLSDFVTYAPEIPFAKPLPKREIYGSSGRYLPRMTLTLSPVVNSVPVWLPPFPDASVYSERFTKDRSDHLWENCVSVICRETLPENSESERVSDRSGGRLPHSRVKVRFKIERNRNSGGETRLERWRDKNDGESGLDFVVMKKNIEEYIDSPNIFW